MNKKKYKEKAMKLKLAYAAWIDSVVDFNLHAKPEEISTMTISFPGLGPKKKKKEG